MLEESRDGSIRCGFGWIKKMDNFKTTAWVIDYEVILDRVADWDWPVGANDFPIIDENGDIHKGEHICRSIISLERMKNSPERLFPGTRGKYRFFYETFPKEGTVASIMAIRRADIQGRMDLLSAGPTEKAPEKMSNASVTVPHQDDLRERVESLERQLRILRSELYSLRSSLSAGTGAPGDPKSPMRDPGITYHPLENK